MQRAVRGARRFGGCVCGACVLSSAAERVLFDKQPNREGCFLVLPRFSLSCTMAVAPFRLEQGWTNEASTARLFRVGPPWYFAFVLCGSHLGSSEGLPSSSSWPRLLVTVGLAPKQEFCFTEHSDCFNLYCATVIDMDLFNLFGAMDLLFKLDRAQCQCSKSQSTSYCVN